MVLATGTIHIAMVTLKVMNLVTQQLAWLLSQMQPLSTHADSYKELDKLYFVTHFVWSLTSKSLSIMF